MAGKMKKDKVDLRDVKQLRRNETIPYISHPPPDVAKYLSVSETEMFFVNMMCHRMDDWTWHIQEVSHDATSIMQRVGYVALLNRYFNTGLQHQQFNMQTATP